MFDNIHATELLSAYALGSLDEEEALQVAAHLASCPACRSELLAYETVAGKLALAAPLAAPPAELKQQILAQIQTPHAEPAAEPRPSWWQHVASLLVRTRPAWRFATLILVAALVMTNLWWWQRTQRQEAASLPGGMKIVAMVGTGVAPQATGTLIINEGGEYGTLVVDGLPALDQDHQYQLWLIRDGRRTSGGVFSVNPDGYGALWVSAPQPLSAYQAFGVTIEPAGGSAGPTGDKVLGTR